MNNIGIVRLESLRMHNFKNIEDGEIFYSEKKRVQRGDIDPDDFKNVLGIYGQNGSGKTSALNALRVIQILLSGNSLNDTHTDYCMFEKDSYSIGADFLINFDNNYYYVQYDVKLGVDDHRIFIMEESLSYKDNFKDNITYKFSYPDNINNQFLNKMKNEYRNTYKLITRYETNNTIGGAYSTIFNSKLIEIINNNKSLESYYWIVLSLNIFASSRLSIYSINYFNENPNVGIRFRFKQESIINENDNRHMIIKCGDIFVPFTYYSKLPKNQFIVFSNIVKTINKVLPNIIPNYYVEIVMPKDIAVVNEVDSDYVSFVIAGKKNGHVIPLIHESNGIKKIISILSGLIEAYSNEGCLIAIDEIDSGVFEYLLGELIYAFDNFSNGQLMFTSHNLRILEKINYKSIFFTTTNPKEVFIQLTNVKGHNNLRDLYYRLIANPDTNNYHLFDLISTEDIIASMNVEGSLLDDKMFISR